MAMVEPSLVAVFLIGLFGGVHCAGMCGGIVAALGMVAARPVSVVAGGAAARAVEPAALPIATRRVLAFNLARVSTYTLLGALAGAFGSLGLVLERVLPVQQTALVIANLMLLVMGLYIAGWRRAVMAVEALGAPLWRRVRPFASRALSRRDLSGLLSAGALWGLVPCGMVYTVLIASVTTGSARDGALLMAAFGLGTLPNLVLMGTSARWLARLRRHRTLRVTLGAVLIAFALAGLFRIDRVLGMPMIGALGFGAGDMRP